MREFTFFNSSFRAHSADQPYVTSLYWIQPALANSLMLMTVFLERDMYTDELIRKECVGRVDKI